MDVLAGNGGQANKLYLNDGSGGFPASGTAIGSDTDVTDALSLGGWWTATVISMCSPAISVKTNFTSTMVVAASPPAARPLAVRRQHPDPQPGGWDGDGDLDVLAGNGGQTNKLYLNDGSGGFPASGTAIGSEKDITWDLSLGDVDGDGDLDVLAGNFGQNKLYLNDGSGGFPASGTAIGSDTGQHLRHQPGGCGWRR